MPVSFTIRNPEKLARSIQDGFGARPTIRMGLRITGPASAYAMIWEWGAAWRTSPGPKTTWGTNPDGEVVIMTLTAPFGYIRVNRPKFRDFIREEVRKIRWSHVKVANIEANLKKALNRAGKRCAELIAETAPIDTGQLREAIEVAEMSDLEINDVLSVRPRIAL